MNTPLLIGTSVDLYLSGRFDWRVASVLWIGERYYGLIDGNGVVSLMPADLVEKRPVRELSK